ncbi:MAG: tRNA threonylcarbamoyladenosine dehydratase [Oscillospiraceae bacterium]|nr:tRNA threonylcarbamoyladenosine dehydratase [Oscillospiraceae bacterium]
MPDQFLRMEMILGKEAMRQLHNAHVAVFGIGGVGGYAAEALARSGVGAITLVDHDAVALTNLNRQAEALHSTLRQPKVQAMAQRILDIYPDCKVEARMDYYSADTREKFFDGCYDYIIDAIDLVSCKLDLIETALNRNIPIISALGTGNKLRLSGFRTADISETSGCPLARIIRRELRRRGIYHHKVIFSPELPAKIAPGETPPPGRRSVPASVPWVPGSVGFMLAGEVVLALAGQ